MRENGEILLNFYGLVSLSVHCPPRIARFLRSEWGAFSASESPGRFDITIRWARVPNGRGGGDVRRRVQRAGGWYKGCFWRATVSESESNTRVDYLSVPRSAFLFKDSCIEPLLLSKLAEKGLHSLHASSLLIGKKAWIFCGSPGSGKTVLGLLGAAAGYTLVSDDISFVRDRIAIGYPVPPRISPRENLNRRLLQELVAHNMEPELMFNHFVSSSTFGRVRVPTRLTGRTGRFGGMQSNNGYQIGGVIFMKTARGPPVLEPVFDRWYAIQEAVDSWPQHGGSILSDSHSNETGRYIRRQALSSGIGFAVDSQRCYVLRVPARASGKDWKEAFRQVESIAEELD